MLALGVLIGKSSISRGGENATYGIGIGFILAPITIQVVVLVFAWLTANGRIPAKSAPAAWPAQPPQAYSGHQADYPAQPAQPGAYGPPQTYSPPSSSPRPAPPRPFCRSRATPDTVRRRVSSDASAGLGSHRTRHRRVRTD